MAPPDPEHAQEPLTLDPEPLQVALTQRAQYPLIKEYILNHNTLWEENLK